MMKKMILFAFMTLMSLGTFAQTVKQVLNKTANIIGNIGGASANFSLSSTKYGSTSGTIAIKGNKFNAHTPQATVWYNGKTQWTYMKNTNEVNVSNPTQAQQMSMNPYTFINIYKTGYNSSLNNAGSNYEQEADGTGIDYHHQQENLRSFCHQDETGQFLEHNQGEQFQS